MTRHNHHSGFPSEFRGIKYINSPIKGKFKWEFEVILRDLDGSMSETGKKNSIITPNMAILDQSSCSKIDSWSHGAVEGAICDDKVGCPDIFQTFLVKTSFFVLFPFFSFLVQR